ncbi:hypothetical protein ACL02T_08025 [Pseudonocardia sp. RS010]|uniref:hypothetical protein n=1 Tax=Pseudonocardia sp. RS010 TaxID=3385979 RepID=UPI0039A3BDEB
MSSKIVSVDGWTRAVLEEVLFRAATRVESDDEEPRGDLQIPLSFSITADPAGVLTLTFSSVTEGDVAVQLERPF